MDVHREGFVYEDGLEKGVYEDGVEGFEVSTKIDPTAVEETKKDKVMDAPKTDAYGIKIKPGTSSTDVSFNIGTEKPDSRTMTEIGKQQIDYTKSLDFTAGNLNPLLKETIKRIVSIDSQYRDQNTYALSTDFTFNLSDTLIDVVSLKLYSIQIPYTWYTISNNFGSNFFYFKGISPGINNSEHDYKVHIPAGNYTAPQLINDLHQSIQTIKESVIDVSFGTTDISYNINAAKTTLILDMQKAYTSMNYYIDFPTWTSPNDEYTTIVTTNQTNTESRYNSIPGYLGFNNTSYESYVVYSQEFETEQSLSTQQYTYDNSNNYFTIIFYDASMSEYRDPSPPPSSDSIRFSFGDLNDAKLPIGTLVNNINTSFSTHTKLTGSKITIDDKIDYKYRNTDSAGNAINSTSTTRKYRIKMEIKLTRQTNVFYKNMKTILVFPPDTNIWTGPTSCFKFDNSLNELDNIWGETATDTSNFIITNSPYIYLKCTKPGYGTTVPILVNGGQSFRYDDSIDHKNTYHIITRDNSPYTINDGIYVVGGYDYTIVKETREIMSGNVDISGTRYIVKSPNPYNITGNTHITGNIHIVAGLGLGQGPGQEQESVWGNVTVEGHSGNTYVVTGTDYCISGNAFVRGNVQFTKGNIFVENTNPYDVSGNYYDLNEYSSTDRTKLVSGNIQVASGNITVGLPTSTSYNIMVEGNDYYLKGNVKITDTLNVINGTTQINSASSYTLSGNNVTQPGNAYILTGTTKIIDIINIVSGTTTIVPESTNQQYTISANTGGNYFITGLNGNTVSLNSMGTLVQIGVITPSSVYENKTYIYGNSTISGNSYTINSIGEYTINGTITVNGNVNVNRGNVNIQGIGNSYSIQGTGYTIVDGNAYVKGQSKISSGNVLIESGNTYYISVPLNINQPYNIYGNAYLNGNVHVITGNANIQSSNPYIVKGINGNIYKIRGLSTNIGGNISGNISGSINIEGNVSIVSQNDAYDISGTHFSTIGNVQASGNTEIIGNSTVKSAQSYSIEGTDYTLSGSYIFGNTQNNGNTYILQGNSIITGNTFTVTGNVQVYKNQSDNDYRINIGNKTDGYTFEKYIANVNTQMQSTVNLNINLKGSSITLDTGTTAKTSIKIDIHNRIDMSGNYKLDLTDCYLNTGLHIINITSSSVESSILDVSTNTTYNIFTGDSDIQGGGYLINNLNNTMVIKSVGKQNGNIPDIILTITEGTYTNLNSLQNAINAAFKQTDTIYGVDAAGTYITLSQFNNKVTATLTVNITTELVENDYTAYFYDDDLIQRGFADISGYYNTSDVWNNNTDLSKNSWYNYLKIPNQSYALQSVPGQIYAEIVGTERIQSNLININNSNNFFNIRARYDLSGGVYTTDANTTYTDLSYNDIRIYIDTPKNTTRTYTKEQLKDLLNAAFDKNSLTAGTLLSFYIRNDKQEYSKLRLNINKVFTASDYSVVFYDPVKFSKCNLGASGRYSVRNVAWDSTLGWILGYRSTNEYYLSSDNIESNPNIVGTFYTGYSSNLYTYDTTTNITSLTGDTAVSMFIYNYFMIVLDDYTQNHLNDGLVTIIPSQTDIALPSYANRNTHRCDPITKQPMISNANINNNALTAKQLYSANQILNQKNKNAQSSNFTSGPFVQDIFGLIPIKVTGLIPGQPYIEFGGTLQLQERSYFGPVNIRRMSIRLVNDKGDVVDLNGANWSFSLICEQLYTATNK